MPENKKNMIRLFVQRVRKIMGNHLKKALVYGSYARGDYREDSDIDLMLLTDLSDSEIEQVEKSIFDLAFDFLMDYDLDISVVVKNEAHFNYWLGALPFYNNVSREGIVIDG